MAFTVETGTGLADANSNGSVAEFKSYHDDRGGDYSSSTDTQIEQALVKATDYIERRFKAGFVGYRKTSTQALSWPRTSAYYRSDGRTPATMPVEVKQATFEYAMRALSDDLAPDPSYEDSNANVVERSESVGPIKESYVFANGGAKASFRKYPMADALLSDLLVRGREVLRV